MKNRDFLETVANGTITEEAIEYAKAALEKLDATNAKKRENPPKAVKEKRAENEILKEKVYAVLTENPTIAADVLTAVGENVTVQKIGYILRALVADGKAEAVAVKVPTKGLQNGYIRI